MWLFVVSRDIQLSMEAEKGNFPHPQNAEVCSAICGALLRNLRNSSPQFAETVFRNLWRYCLLKPTSASYIFQFVRVPIEFVTVGTR